MITFIVIGRNESWRLERCLKAIRKTASSELKQPYEIIYVDSKSTDGSVELAQQYADRIFLITGECSAAIGRNVGAMEARGEVLFFLDGDMELLPGVLATIFTVDGKLVSSFLSGTGMEYLHDANWKEIETCPRMDLPGLMVIEKQLWDEVGGMDSRFVRAEDMDFIWRAGSKDVEYHRMSQLWVNHYTRYYAVRSESYSVHKYDILLTRRHLFDKQAFRYLTLMNYSCYCLIVCLIAFAISINFLVLIPYFLLLVYRTVRIVKHTNIRSNFIYQMWRRFIKDLIFIWYFLTYFPEQPIVSYRRVK